MEELYRKENYIKTDDKKEKFKKINYKNYNRIINNRIRIGREVYKDCINREQGYIECKNELKEFLIDYQTNEIEKKYYFKNIHLNNYKNKQLSKDLNKIIFN